MARSDIAGTSRILQAAEIWRDQCLMSEISVFSGARLWTLDIMSALHDAFWGNLIEDPEKSFYEKLKIQVAGRSPELAQLAAEIIWVLLLFSNNIRGTTKRRDIRQIWSWSGGVLAETHSELGEVLDQGIGNSGTAYSTLRWKEFGYFLKVARALLARDQESRQALLADPWTFAAWLDGQESSDKRQFRHILLYLLFPDSFERISVTKHKRAIVNHFGSLIGVGLTPREIKRQPFTELDRHIFNIRGELAKRHPGSQLDFYRPPLTEQLDLKGKSGQDDDEAEDELEPPENWSTDAAVRSGCRC